MKKIILITTGTLLLLLLLVIFIGVPIMFHQVIHEKVLAQNFQTMKIDFEDFGFNEKSSHITLPDGDELKVKTVSKLNPLNNFINVDYNSPARDISLNFQIYFHLQGVSAITLEAKFSDEHFTQKNSHVELKDLSIFLKSFNISDLKNLAMNNLALVLADKQVNLRLGSGIYKIAQIEGSVNDLSLELGNKINGDDLAFNFSTDIQNLINDHLGEKLGLKSTRIELDLTSFEKNLALQFISTVPVKVAMTRAPPSIFEVLPYIRSIHYPLEFKLHAMALNSGQPTHLNLDAALTSQTFLSLNSYTANLDYKNKLPATSALLKELILQTFPKASARRFALAQNLPPDQAFMQRAQVKTKIQEILRAELATKDLEIITAAIDSKIIIKEGELYLTQMSLDKGTLTLNGTKYSLKKAMALPSQLLNKIYPVGDGYLLNLLISKGLFPVDPR